MTTVLLTGFEPFGGDLENPSGLAVLAATELWTGPGEIIPIVLPVVFDEASRIVCEAIDELSPDIVVCVGLAAGAPGIRVERVAINIDDARIPDNSGATPIDEPVRDGGPAAHFATIPIKSIVRELGAQGIVAQISNTAGTYVCNHVFYSTLDYLGELNAADGGVRRGGFLHVPSIPKFSPDGGICSGSAPTMPVEVTARALVIAVDTALRVREDSRLPGGRLN